VVAGSWGGGSDGHGARQRGGTPAGIGLAVVGSGGRCMCVQDRGGEAADRWGRMTQCRTAGSNNIQINLN
jgi:hypothetical protein